MFPNLRIFKTRAIPLLIGGSLFISSCANSSRVSYDSPEEAYTKGMTSYEEGKFRRSAAYFQGVFDFGRTHEWAAESQLYLARSYRGSKEYLLAANEFGRFIQIYRSDERVPDAEYEMALTFLDRSPEFDLDQNPTEAAINQFRLFLGRNPNHELVDEAQARILELRGKLAEKQFRIGQQYERREMYKAAAVSYESVFDQYYDSEFADDALLGALKMYLGFANQSVRAAQKKRLDKAVVSYDRLLQIFPDSPLLEEAQLVYDKVLEELDRFVEPS